jgi:hypothetical protein
LKILTTFFNLYYRYVRQQIIDNCATGRIGFDDNGDRMFAEYNIVNVKSKNIISSVGRYFYSSVSLNIYIYILFRRNGFVFLKIPIADLIIFAL